MCNPNPLRLCCLAAMAPALTSEAVTRARDKLTGSPASPSVPVMNGRDHQMIMNSTNKTGITQPPRPNFPMTTLPSQAVSLSKDLQKKLTEGSHLVDRSKSMEHAKAVNLGTITSLSQLYQHQQQEVFGTSSGTQSHQVDNLVFTSPSIVSSSVSQSLTSRSLVPAVSQSNGSVAAAGILAQSSTASRSDTTASVNQALCRTCPSVTSQKAGKSMATVYPKEKGVSKEVTVIHPVGQQHTPLHPKMNVSNGFSALVNVGAHPKPSGIPAVPSLDANKLCSLVVGRSNTDKQSTSQVLNTVEKRQKILETRAGHLMCRLRRLQCRQAISHTKQQLSGFVEQQQQVMPTCSRTATMDLQTELLHSKSMSTAALVELVHKMQSSKASQHQHLSMSSQNPNEPTRLGEERCAELERVSNHLRSNLSHLQSALDSDATESSSGGESCDELDYDEDWDGRVPRPPM